MNARTKLGAYGLLLAAVLGGGAVVGAAAGPIDVGGDEPHATTHTTRGEEERAMTSELPAGGLLVAQDGYAIEPEDRLADAGEFAFTIVGPDGTPVESYDQLHDRELHLIVASRDLRRYTHLHPERDASGRWSAELPALPAGAYRAFADFRPTGADQYTLGVDLEVPGTTEAAAPLVPTSSDAVDGFDVTLDRDVEDGGTEVTVTVRRDGEVVTTEPYLGAAGHLVALRDGDLAYLHVHPLDDEPSGPVRFAVDVPSAGTYALFFDFQVDGQVRTARFVLDATAPPADPAAHGADSEH
jgi:hypothetical protein